MFGLVSFTFIKESLLWWSILPNLPKTNNGQIPVIMRVTENHNNIACLELAKMTFGWGPKPPKLNYGWLFARSLATQNVTMEFDKVAWIIRRDLRQLIPGELVESGVFRFLTMTWFDGMPATHLAVDKLRKLRISWITCKKVTERWERAWDGPRMLG